MFDNCVDSYAEGLLVLVWACVCVCVCVCVIAAGSRQNDRGNASVFLGAHPLEYVPVGLVTAILPRSISTRDFSACFINQISVAKAVGSLAHQLHHFPFGPKKMKYIRG